MTLQGQYQKGKLQLYATEEEIEALPRINDCSTCGGYQWVVKGNERSFAGAWFYNWVRCPECGLE